VSEARNGAAAAADGEWVARLPAGKLQAAAEKLKQRRRAAGSAPAAMPPPRPAGPLPLSFAQERLWFLDQLVPGSSFYNLAEPLQLTGRLDPAAMAAALSAVMVRHEVLRTSFPSAGGKPLQRIRAPQEARLELPVADLSALPPQRGRQEALRLAAEEATRPFDLAAGPLLRAVLLHLGPAPAGRAAERWVALLTLHHIAADGWSMGVLVREFGELYAAARAGRPARLPPLVWQYADYALWQRSFLSG
jgi:hypothetical protein